MTQETTLVDDNPAVADALRCSPKMLFEVAEDPAAAQPLLRGMALKQAVELYNLRTEMTHVQRMDLLERFAKLGNMVPKTETQAPAAAQVVINFVRRANNSTVTIDGESKQLEVTDAA